MSTDEVLTVQARAERCFALSQELRALEREMAPLTARYGTFGSFEHERKILLSQLIGALLASAGEKKPTDKVLDAAAHADARYVALIDAAYAARQRLAELQGEQGHLDRSWRTENQMLYYATRLPTDYGHGA